MGQAWEKTVSVCYVSLPPAAAPGLRQILVHTTGDPRSALALANLSAKPLKLLLYARTADEIIAAQIVTVTSGSGMPTDPSLFSPLAGLTQSAIIASVSE